MINFVLKNTFYDELFNFDLRKHNMTLFHIEPKKYKDTKIIIPSKRCGRQFPNDHSIKKGKN